MEQNQRRHQTKEIVDNATHKTGIRTINVQPKNQYVLFEKTRGHFAKACKFERRKRQEIEEITEPEETEESDTDKSINTLTEMKHVTNRRNHITMTIQIYGTEIQFIVDTG